MKGEERGKKERKKKIESESERQPYAVGGRMLSAAASCIHHINNILILLVLGPSPRSANCYVYDYVMTGKCMTTATGISLIC